MEVTTHTDTPFPTDNDVVGETTSNRAAASVHGTVDKAAGAAGQYISAHPWKSIGIALAAGFLISRFIRSGQMACSMWMAGGCVRVPVQPKTRAPK